MSPGRPLPALRDRSFLAPLAILLAASLALRLAYLAVQAGGDPTFRFPALDGAYYVDWARGLSSGGETPGGAYYLAPLYPHWLAVVFRLFGESLSIPLLLQHLLALASATALAFYTRRKVGAPAGVAAAGLFLTHQPLLFFASRPLGETLAVFLLTLALAAGEGRRIPGVLPGLASGLASLARPNLLLVPVVWAIRDLLLRRRRSAMLLLAGTVLAVLPVTVRNFVVSGHLVPVSANGGITAFHGNGPGARGTYTPHVGLSGRLDGQRAEATELAGRRSGLELDSVEADRWWGAEALRVRLASPVRTAALLARRTLLLLDNREHGLDDHPLLDSNPFRLTWRVAGPGGVPPAELPLIPFGLILALAVAGLSLGGIRGSGGDRLWAALAATAVTPILFYVSSRYRLPFTALLVVPAGAGLAGLLQGTIETRRRVVAAALGMACLVGSFSIPWPELQRVGLAGALSNRSFAHQHAGDLRAAERDVRLALEVNERDDDTWTNLGAILTATNRTREAEDAYRRALALNPFHPAAAGNLAQLLTQRGDPAAAVPILRRALTMWPSHTPCWTNLVVALHEAGDDEAARQAAAEGSRHGVNFHPGLLREIAATDPE